MGGKVIQIPYKGECYFSKKEIEQIKSENLVFFNAQMLEVEEDEKPIATQDKIEKILQLPIEKFEARISKAKDTSFLNELSKQADSVRKEIILRRIELLKLPEVRKIEREK